MRIILSVFIAILWMSVANCANALSKTYSGISELRESQSTSHDDSVYVSKLPVHAFPARNTNPDKPLIVIISGDGGWNSFIDGLAGTYTRNGYDVAGVDALKYFWHKTDPGAASSDFSKIIGFYARKWHRNEVVVIGYSFGADVLPFIFNDFPADIKNRINLMSPSHHATFEFQLTGWLTGDSNSPYHVVPEIKKITGPGLMVIYGKKESETLVGDLPASKVSFVGVEGGHHYNDNYRALTTPVLKAIDDHQ
jgi:type IV secretory pathway VirJ component